MSFYCSANLSMQQALLNRGLLFGESPFTTMLSHQGRFLFLSDHLERLSKAYQYLYQKEDWKKFEKKIIEALEGLKKTQGLYSFRITFFQSLEDNEINFFIYRNEVKETFEDSISLAIAESRRVSNILPVYFKNGNYCESNMELRAAKKNGFDDILFLDDRGFLKECSTSNIFFRKENIVYTPKLSVGLLGGITRANLLKCLGNLGIQVNQGDYNLDDINSADEVWVTSSIKGVRRVHKIENQEFPETDTWNQEIAQSFKSFCGLE